MKNTYYIHDASDGRLVIVKLARVRDEEAAIMRLAEAEGMRWSDCSWGGVRAIRINL